MRALAVGAVLLTATSCAAPPTAQPAADGLRSVVASVWPLGSIPRGPEVRWIVGDPGPDDWAASTFAYCLFGRCFAYDVTVRPDAINRRTVGHEGGHVICAALFYDFTEECAEREAGDR